MRKEDLFPDMAEPDPSKRLRNAATRIRALRSQVGHDGFSPNTARTLIDELTSVLEEIAKALERPSY
jgi:uncharacterized protein (UPF0147 family)